MKINLLFLLVPMAVAACLYIVHRIQGQSEHTFFGTAETEPAILHVAENVLVREVFAAAGEQVRQGDTLALMYRADLEQEALANQSEFAQVEAGHLARLELIARERETVMAQAGGEISALRAEIRQVEIQDSIERGVKAAMFPGLKTDRTVTEARIAALRDEISNAEKIMQQRLRELDAQAEASGKMTGARRTESMRRQELEVAERRKLALIAPVDGYVDQVHIAPGMPVQAFREMLRIYPLRPAKVIGFIHETATVPFHIGDSVTLVSGVRSDQQIKGQIVAASPKLVELPLRLRKFVEVRAWGREVIIHLPQDNPYYIGERITISLQTLPE